MKILCFRFFRNVIVTSCLLTLTLLGYSKPHLNIFVERATFDSKFLNNLQKEFRKNFEITLKLNVINNFGDEDSLVNRIINGSIFEELKINKEDGAFYLFLTSNGLFIENTKLFEVRGIASENHSVGIVSSHLIKTESNRLGTNYEFHFFKAAKHEFLHLLGLSHCESTLRCIMVTSFPASNFHNSPDRICSVCCLKINSSLIKKRLSKV